MEQSPAVPSNLTADSKETHQGNAPTHAVDTDTDSPSSVVTDAVTPVNLREGATAGGPTSVDSKTRGGGIPTPRAKSASHRRRLSGGTAVDRSPHTATPNPQHSAIDVNIRETRAAQQPQAQAQQQRKQESRQQDQTHAKQHRRKPTTTKELHSQHPKVYRYDGYEDLQPIGKGKFATVYRGVRSSDGRPVAIKRVHNFGSLNERKREKCIKEVGLLQTFDHPNIIGYLDSFQSDNDLIIVCEWAEAGDLKRQIRKAVYKRARFHEYTIWKYFLQIAEALRYMHSHRVLHRDLKPANIFITADACIKVGDLGLSRGLSDQTIMVYTKVGTPLYMSPEVIVGEGYSHPSDVWSLGCILFELCSLHSPFKEKGLNLASLFEKIKRGHYQPVSTKYSPQLRNLIARMLLVDPAARPNLDEICELASYMKHESARQRAIQRAQEHAQRVLRQQKEQQQHQLQSNAQAAPLRQSSPVQVPTQHRPASRDGSPPTDPKRGRRPQRLALQGAMGSTGPGIPSPQLLTAFSPSPVGPPNAARSQFHHPHRRSSGNMAAAAGPRGRARIVSVDIAADADEQAAIDAVASDSPSVAQVQLQRQGQSGTGSPGIFGSPPSQSLGLDGRSVGSSAQPSSFGPSSASTLSSHGTAAAPAASNGRRTGGVEEATASPGRALNQNSMDLLQYAREMGRQVALMGGMNVNGHAALQQAGQQLRQQQLQMQQHRQQQLRQLQQQELLHRARMNAMGQSTGQHQLQHQAPDTNAVAGVGWAGQNAEDVARNQAPATQSQQPRTSGSSASSCGTEARPERNTWFDDGDNDGGDGTAGGRHSERSTLSPQGQAEASRSSRRNGDNESRGNSTQHHDQGSTRRRMAAPDGAAEITEDSKQARTQSLRAVGGRRRSHTCPDPMSVRPRSAMGASVLVSPRPHHKAWGQRQFGATTGGLVAAPPADEEQPQRPLSEPSDFLAGVNQELKNEIDVMHRHGPLSPRLNSHPLTRLGLSDAPRSGVEGRPGQYSKNGLADFEQIWRLPRGSQGSTTDRQSPNGRRAPGTSCDDRNATVN